MDDLGSSGEGRRRRVRGEGRPAVALLAGGDAPVGFGRGGWALEFQWSKAKLVAVTAWAVRC